MKTVKKDIVIMGAGKIGRGLVAEIFYKSGYQLTFIDENKQLINALQERGQYIVIHLPDKDERQESVISGYEAYSISDNERVNSKLEKTATIAVAVFPESFGNVTEEIAKAIEERAFNENPQTLDIIICSNTFQPAKKFKKLLEDNLSLQGKRYLEDKVGLVETVVIRLAIEPTEEMKKKDPLVILTNGYPYMPMDKKAFKGELPRCEMIAYTENIFAEEVRKMYTYNMLHAAFCYIGFQKNLQYLVECTEDKEIREIADNILKEASRGLQLEFSFSDEDMEKWNKRVMIDMSNPNLKAKLTRMGSNPVRKLKKDDRLVGPALICRKNSIMPYYLAKAIAGAFIYFNPQDEACVVIKEYLIQNGIIKAIKHFTQLEEEVELISMVVEHYNKMIAGCGIKENTERVRLIKEAYEKV
ncbi:MAG: hypothetical protein ACOWWR_10400 [Eubacteriales bacterium]